MVGDIFADFVVANFPVSSQPMDIASINVVWVKFLVFQILSS